MATFRALVLKGKNDTKADGSTNIKIRITHRQKVNYISTDLYINPTEMDNKTGLIKYGPNKKFVNQRITSYLNKYQKKEIELGDQSDYMSVAEIKKYILTGKSSSFEIDFFEFVEEFAKSVRVKGTADKYLSLVASLKKFNGDKLPVSDITLSFLFQYHDYLRSRNVRNGLINYMTTFRALFNKCRDYYNDEDTGRIPIPHYPFRKYKFPTRESMARDHVLTVDELRLFMDYKPENAGEEFAMDIFMLMFYLIGIESKDLYHLNKAQKGRAVYDRYKTGRAYSIKLEPEAMEIIMKYQGDETLLNVSARFKHNKSFYRAVNNYLHGDTSHDIRGIFQKLGIRKPVTTKWSRHTWATIARNDCRINKDDIALCLGHEDSDNRVTDMYVKYDYSIIDESNRKVLDFINNLGENDSNV
ncbi:MAG: phage integrase SAM-like domain-containing protein [Bacteroidetes bacterium]|nr:phage integrase SAM-like domain-containing protein [Bacteroidota bacterium]